VTRTTRPVVVSVSAVTVIDPHFLH
jgi:hypothetical protein